MLADLWLRELTAERVEELSVPDTAVALRSLPLELPQIDDNLEENLLELQIDYCQLLVGPKNHISPVESVWTSQQYQSASVDEMKSFFEVLPQYHAPDRFHDHIGVQLDFAGHLLKSAAPTGQNHDSIDDILRVFVDNRLAWTAPFLQKVKHQSQTTFYRQLADATGHWLSFCKP